MTDDRKPATPGMSEVSPKFVDEAEAAVEGGTSTDEALSTLWQEHERLTAQYSEAIKETDLAFTAKLAITDTETPEYRAAATAHEAAAQRQQEVSDTIVATENRMAKVLARTIEGPLLKLRVVGVEVADEFKGRDGVLDESLLGSVERLTLSALADLERLAGTALPEDPVLALKREWEARYKALDEHRDDPAADDSDEAVQPFYDRLHETEIQILRTQATTPAGIAVKLILWARQHCNADEVSGLSWTRKSIEGKSFDLDRLPVMSALLDLERMSQGIAPSTTEEPVIDNKGVTTRGLDPVAQIGRDLTTIWRQVWQNDDEGVGIEAHSPESSRQERREYHLADRREALEAMAAEIQASSLEGVMVQIMLAHAEADVMAASTEESNEAQMRTISKLLYSTLAALERLAGVPREKLGGEAYLTRALDPRALVAEVEHLATADKSEA